MAALNRPTNATYEVHENVTVDTQDNEDHTFCGIMFPIKCKDLLPIEHLVIKSVSVRGRLGPLTVWVSKNQENENFADSTAEASASPPAAAQGRQSSRRRNNRNSEGNRLRVDRIPDSNRTRNSIDLHPRAWTKVFGQTIKASFREYQELVLDKPIRLKPGETRVIYIHSTLPGDEAIVYDNSYYGTSAKRFEDDKLAILTGRAHVSTECFGTEPIWGWGNPWRDRREFVGRLAYGTVYKLWNPEVHPKFGGSFQDGARALLMCQRRYESPWSILPDECVYYILNMCRWDWFNDCSDTMKERRRRERNILKLAPAASASASASPPASEVQDDSMEDAKPRASESRCSRVTRTQARASGASLAMDGTEEVEHDDDPMEKEDGDSYEAGDDDEEEEENTNSDAWSEESDDEDQYHTANRRQFSFHDIDSDDDEDENQQDTAETQRRGWIRRQFARIHVLRALASMEDQAVDVEDQSVEAMDT